MIKFTRKVLKNSRGTYYVSIPRELIKDFKIKDGQKLNLFKKGKNIVIEDWE